MVGAARGPYVPHGSASPECGPCRARCGGLAARPAPRRPPLAGASSSPAFAPKLATQRATARTPALCAYHAYSAAPDVTLGASEMAGTTIARVLRAARNGPPRGAAVHGAEAAQRMRIHCRQPRQKVVQARATRPPDGARPRGAASPTRPLLRRRMRLSARLWRNAPVHQPGGPWEREREQPRRREVVRRRRRIAWASAARAAA